MRAVRLLLQAILFFFLLAVVIAIGSAETGVWEKLVLAVIGGVLVWIAVQVRQIGQGPRSV
jgi:hypothetical protein